MAKNTGPKTKTVKIGGTTHTYDVPSEEQLKQYYAQHPEGASNIPMQSGTAVPGSPPPMNTLQGIIAPPHMPAPGGAAGAGAAGAAKPKSDTEAMQALQAQAMAPFVQQMHAYAKMLGGLNPKQFGVSGPYASVFSQLLPAEAGAYDQLANAWQQYSQAAPMLNQLLNMIPSGTTAATTAAGGIDPAQIAAMLGGGTTAPATAPKV